MLLLKGYNKITENACNKVVTLVQQNINLKTKHLFIPAPIGFRGDRPTHPVVGHPIVMPHFRKIQYLFKNKIYL